MEEKKFFKRQNRFWPVSGNWNIVKYIFRRSDNSIYLPLFRNLKAYHKSLIINHKSSKAFTIIEFLVVSAVLGVLLTSALLVINPTQQIQKSRDVTRQNDLQLLSNALDTYYHDNDCFPPDLNSLQDTYIKNIPEDPETGGLGYVYQVDSSSCPQWGVLFAKLKNKNANVISCALEKITDNCLPEGYDAGYNYCLTLGNIGTLECASINLGTIP